MQSLLDDYGLADVSKAAEAVKQAVEQGQFLKATELWSMTESAVERVCTTLHDLEKMLAGYLMYCLILNCFMEVVFHRGKQGKQCLSSKIYQQTLI